MNIAIIFAGGAGQRMNTNGVPKQFLKVYGKPILVWTIEKFQYNENIDAIIVVILSQGMDILKDCKNKYGLTKIQAIVNGGETGQESIFNGIAKAKEIYGANNEKNIVLIHDGVRPFINNKLINNCINDAKICGNAIAVSPAIETVVKLDQEKNISDIIDRFVCYHAKAPQCFLLNDIYSVHLKAIEENKRDYFIDSASLMSSYGYQLHSVLCNSENIKITTPKDFYTMKALLEAEESYQILGI